MGNAKSKSCDNNPEKPPSEFPFPEILLDSYSSSKMYDEDKLEKELLLTPSNMLGINLNTIEPTNVRLYDTEEGIQSQIGSFMLTMPTDLLIRYEKIQEYKKIEWMKLLHFPCGEFIIIKYKPNYYQHLEYFIGQLGLHQLYMYFPPNFVTGESTIRMLTTKKHFNRINAICVCLRLFRECTSKDVSLTQPTKLWKGLWFNVQQYLGTFPLTTLHLHYNPLNVL